MHNTAACHTMLSMHLALCVAFLVLPGSAPSGKVSTNRHLTSFGYLSRDVAFWISGTDGGWPFEGILGEVPKAICKRSPKTAHGIRDTFVNALRSAFQWPGAAASPRAPSRFAARFSGCFPLWSGAGWEPQVFTQQLPRQTASACFSHEGFL